MDTETKVRLAWVIVWLSLLALLAGVVWLAIVNTKALLALGLACSICFMLYGIVWAIVTIVDN